MRSSTANAECRMQNVELWVMPSTNETVDYDILAAGVQTVHKLHGYW